MPYLLSNLASAKASTSTQAPTSTPTPMWKYNFHARMRREATRHIKWEY